MKSKRIWLVLACLLLGVVLQAEDNFFEVKKDRGVPRIWMNGKVVPSRIFFGSFAHGKIPYAKFAVPREFKYAYEETGIRFFEAHGDLLWDGGNWEDIKKHNKERIDRFLSGNPNGLLILRVGVNPPKWWFKNHPESISVWNNGQKGPFQALASEVYQNAVNEALARTIRFYEETYPGKIAGYHPAGLHTSEWVYDTSYYKETEGYDVSTRDGFRKYLRKKYGTDEALQKAWNNKKVTLDTAVVPSHEQRKGDGVHYLREPAEDAYLIDYETFHTKLVSSTIVRLAHTIKTTQPGRLVVFFYGYISLASWYGGGGKNGYLSFRDVLNSPDVDIFCSPFNYNYRRMTQALATQGIMDSINAAGKIWLNEEDTATYRAYITRDGGPSMYSACPTPKETAQVLRRNLVYTYMRNQAIWWMDLNGAGWFDDRDIWKTMKEMLPLEKDLLENPIPFEPELAIALDQRGAIHFIGEHSKEGSPPNFATDHIGIMGAIGTPYGVYLQDDILSGKIPNAKLTLFLSCYALDGAQRKAMRKYAESNGCIWLWAPGYIDLETGRGSLDAVRETTGFTVKREADNVTFAVKATPEGKKYGMPDVMGPKLRYGVPAICNVPPVLSVVPMRGDIVLGRYKDSNNPAIVLRFNKDKKPHIFCGTTILPIEAFRLAGKRAGVHFYTKKIGPAVFSNGKDVGVYATADDTVTVTPKKPGTYKEYFTGKTYTGSEFTFDMKLGDTILLRPQP